MTHVTLSSHKSLLVLAPETGGGIVRLRLDGREILRSPANDPPDDPLRLGEFPMAPWVNRVAGGVFVWNGRRIDLSDGPSGDPQGLHGVCWRMPWTLLDRDASAAALEISWPGGRGWPFPFLLTRRFAVSAEDLTISASLTNTGTEPMPFAIGFHPYFPSEGALLRAEVRARWVTHATGIPACLAADDAVGQLSAGLRIADADLDSCFTDWNGSASIRWPDYTLRLSTEPPLRFLQVYSPPAAGYFCLEPQSAMPDAFNHAPSSGGAGVLESGQTYTVRLTLALEQ